MRCNRRGIASGCGFRGLERVLSDDWIVDGDVAETAASRRQRGREFDDVPFLEADASSVCLVLYRGIEQVFIRAN